MSEIVQELLRQWYGGEIVRGSFIDSLRDHGAETADFDSIIAQLPVDLRDEFVERLYEFAPSGDPNEHTWILWGGTEDRDQPEAQEAWKRAEVERFDRDVLPAIRAWIAKNPR